MKCKHARSLLSSYLDGEVSAKAADSIRAHLSSCDGCRAYMEDMTASRDALRSCLDLSASACFDARVLVAVSARPAVRPSFIDVLIDFMRPGWRQVAMSGVGALVLAYMILGCAGFDLVRSIHAAQSEMILPPDLRMALDDVRGYLDFNGEKSTPGRSLLKHIDQKSEGMQRCCDDTCS